jgi:hypothetical protein
MIKSQSINKKTDRIYIYYMYQNQVQQVMIVPSDFGIWQQDDHV